MIRHTRLHALGVICLKHFPRFIGTGWSVSEFSSVLTFNRATWWLLLFSLKDQKAAFLRIDLILYLNLPIYHPGQLPLQLDVFRLECRNLTCVVRHFWASIHVWIKGNLKISAPQPEQLPFSEICVITRLWQMLQCLMSCMSICFHGDGVFWAKRQWLVMCQESLCLGMWHKVTQLLFEQCL